MDDRRRIAVLESVLEQMLRPVRNVPFDLIIKSLAKAEVIKTDPRDAADADMLKRLEAAIRDAGEAIRRAPIHRPRPNEVGNDIEAFVMGALKLAGLRPTRPTSANGKGKSAGYPDILFHDGNRPVYLECKIASAKTKSSTMR